MFVASSGQEVSFNTTVGDRVKFKIFKLTAHFLKVFNLNQIVYP